LIAVGLWATVALAPPQQAIDADVADDQDDELTRRLIREATGGDDEDVMDRTMRLMQEAQTRLAVRFDPGSETQSVQSAIVQQLDAAIAQAAANRSSRHASQSQPEELDKRVRPKPAKDRPADANPDEATPSTETTTADPASEGVDASRPGSHVPLRETRRGWGHLPRRDREELLQGIESDYLDKYRTMIEQYYRALAEPEGG